MVDSALAVHRHLGPGLLESAYRRCLAEEIASRGVGVECEVAVPLRLLINFNAVPLDRGIRRFVP